MSLNLLPAPSGFQGLHPEKQMRVFTRNLPHWRQDGATYFVTFRLADALPQAKLQELKRLRERLSRGEKLTSETREKIEKAVFAKTEVFLDAGYGSCVLREPECSKIVCDALLHFDGERFELGAATVMPNHVHALVRPLTHELDDVLASIKRFSATEIRRATSTVGRLWQHEGYDRIVRDDEHLWKCLQYIGRNGEAAGVEAWRWVQPSWSNAGWAFRDHADEG